MIVDDHALFRSAVATVLAAALPDVAVLESEGLESAARQAPPPDVVLLDVRLRDSDGLEGLAQMRRRWPGARVVVVSGSERTDVAAEALRRGAVAFLSKAERPERMIALVRELLAGGVAPEAPPAPGSNAAGPRLFAPALADEAPPEPLPSSAPRLTPRQQEVLELLARGLSNKAIGRRLGVSENTVRGHVQATLGVLEASSRAEAAFAARRLGLLA